MDKEEMQKLQLLQVLIYMLVQVEEEETLCLIQQDMAVQEVV